MSGTFDFLQVGPCPHHPVCQDFCELGNKGREKAVDFTVNNNKLFIRGIGGGGEHPLP